MRMPETQLPALLVTPLLLAVAADAQDSFHRRGDGELLPPQVLTGQPAGRVDDDLTRPEYLWAFQRDSLLPEREARQLQPKTLASIGDGLLAASRDGDAELRWQSLWALARIARNDAQLATRLHPYLLGGDLLRSNDVVAEVALVAAGLSAHGDLEALAALAAIATDRTVAEPRRAFAFYGLGLAAQGATTEQAQFRVLAAVERGLLARSEAPPQVRVAALHALALLRLDVAPKLTGPALSMLEGAWAEPPERSAIDFAAHLPLAVASVVPAADPAAEVWRERFAAAVTARDSGSLGMVRSCVLALGVMCRPWQDGASPDAKYGEVLHAVAKEARDLQAANYAWFAIGRSGGARHREFLLRGLGGSFLVKPWAAFGLAASAATAKEADRGVVAAIEAVQKPMKNRNVVVALTAALHVVRRDAPADAAKDFWDRYAVVLPGSGDVDARCASLLDVLGDGNAAAADRRLAAMALGHLGDCSTRHWSAALARAVDYRSGTPALLGLPNGVLRLP
jgi:hypothetical protein